MLRFGVISFVVVVVVVNAYSEQGLWRLFIMSPLLMVERHTSAEEWLSWCRWSTYRPCGRLGRHFQSALHGNMLRERSTCSFKAWWAAVEAGSLATWQKTEDRPLQMNGIIIVIGLLILFLYSQIKLRAFIFLLYWCAYNVFGSVYIVLLFAIT